MLVARLIFFGAWVAMIAFALIWYRELVFWMLVSAVFGLPLLIIATGIPIAVTSGLVRGVGALRRRRQ